MHFAGIRFGHGETQTTRGSTMLVGTRKILEVISQYTFTEIHEAEWPKKHIR